MKIFNSSRIYDVDENNEKDADHVEYMRKYAADLGFDRPYYSQYQLGRILNSADFMFNLKGYYVSDQHLKEMEDDKYEVKEEDKEKLEPYALMLACLQGNAFPELIEQYMKEAKYFLIVNGWWELI